MCLRVGEFTEGASDEETKWSTGACYGCTDA